MTEEKLKSEIAKLRDAIDEVLCYKNNKSLLENQIDFQIFKRLIGTGVYLYLKD